MPQWGMNINKKIYPNGVCSPATSVGADPNGKAKSVVLSDAGLREAEALFRRELR